MLCNGVIILQYSSNALLQCNNSIIILQLHLCLYLHCKGPTFICVMGRQKEFFLIKCVFFLYTCISVRQFWFVWKGGFKLLSDLQLLWSGNMDMAFIFMAQERQQCDGKAQMPEMTADNTTLTVQTNTMQSQQANIKVWSSTGNRTRDEELHLWLCNLSFCSSLFLWMNGNHCEVLFGLSLCFFLLSHSLFFKVCCQLCVCT